MLMHILYFLLLVAPCVMSHAPLLNVGYKYMQVCDNKVAASIPGGIDAVMEMGRKYMDYLHNHSNRESIGGFHGGWKHELWRISRPVFAPNCPNLRTFSVHDYDLVGQLETMKNAPCTRLVVITNGILKRIFIKSQSARPIRLIARWHLRVFLPLLPTGRPITRCVLDRKRLETPFVESHWTPGNRRGLL